MLDKFVVMSQVSTELRYTMTTATFKKVWAR